MRYKIIYHVGSDIGIKTKVKSGYLTWQEDSVLLSGQSQLKVLFPDIVSVEMFRMHGLGRMLKIVTSNITIYLTVVRFNIGNYLAVVNFVRTGQLFDRLNNQPRNIH